MTERTDTREAYARAMGWLAVASRVGNVAGWLRDATDPVAQRIWAERWGPVWRAFGIERLPTVLETATIFLPDVAMRLEALVSLGDPLLTDVARLQHQVADGDLAAASATADRLWSACMRRMGEETAS